MTAIAATGPAGAPDAAPPGGGRPLLLALAVGLILSDSSVVTLALPAILREFDATVNAVAWVLISFNLALALVALHGARLARGRAQRAFAISVALFIAVTAVCALAPSLAVLIAARAAQGLFGAVAVAAALELLVLATGRERAVLLWGAAGVLGAAVGPALGGLLTEALSWQAMFALQVPVALVGLAGARGVRAPVAPRAAAVATERPALAPLAALGLAAAALSAALFLLVILLIEGWRHSPAEAAATVSVMPLAALVAGRWASARRGLVPAIAGALLVAGGLAALGLLPAASPAWTFGAQVAIGSGLGLALATLIGGTVAGAGRGLDADRAAGAVSGPAAWTVAARHAGIVVGLLLLTPIFTHDLEAVRAPAERAGLAHVLDADLGLGPKLELARRLDAEVRAAGEQELPDLDAGFRGLDVAPADRPAIARLRARLDDELDRGATDAFGRSFLAAALLALLAAAAAYAGARAARAGAARGEPEHDGGGGPRLAVAGPGAAALAALLVAGHVALGGGSYEPTPVADPCAQRALPDVERAQRAALVVVDGAACELGVSREELVRALLAGKVPDGVRADRLVPAVAAGIERAERAGELSEAAATALRATLRVGGVLGIAELLLP